MSAGREGDGAAEPLIRRESGESEGLGAGEDVGRRRTHGEAEDEEEQVVSLGWFIWILTFSAGVSGLLFGYEYVFYIGFMSPRSPCVRRSNAKIQPPSAPASSPPHSCPSAPISPLTTHP